MDEDNNHVTLDNELRTILTTRLRDMFDGGELLSTEVRVTVHDDYANFTIIPV